jgi:hypothetical protein
MANHRGSLISCSWRQLSFERANAPLLLALLPGQIFIPAAQGVTGRLGRMAIDLLAGNAGPAIPARI